MLTTAVVGDLCTHGATIITGSPTRRANGQPVARLGDLVDCPAHGKKKIVTIDAGMPLTDGLPTAHEGAKAECGATILRSTHNTPQPFSGLSVGEQAIMEHDDELEDGGAVQGTSAFDQARNRAIMKAAEGAALDSDPSSSEGAPESHAVPQGCQDIPANAGDSFRLSRYFNLGDLSSRAILAPQPGTSSGPVEPNRGLSRQEIICNLRHLAVNALDPIAEHYGRRAMIITSGFRNADGQSDHNIGSAVDIQFYINGTKANGRQLDTIEKYIINVLKIPFTQIIHENNSWVHVACRRNGVNSAKRICWWAGGSYNSGYRY